MKRKRSPISAAERDILKLIKKGHSSNEIATIRECSTRTIEKHRSNIIKKLGLSGTQNALYVYLLKNPRI